MYAISSTSGDIKGALVNGYGIYSESETNEMLEALKENPHSIGAENKLPIMKEKFNEATQQRPDGGGLIDAPMVTIDLPAFMQQIKQEAEHVVELSKGQIIVLHKHIPHSVLAKEESIFMLTLTTTLAEIK